MTETDPAVSVLDGIRETLHVAKEQGFAEWDDAYLPSALYRHTASLLAAVEAALKLADELEHLGTVPPSGKEDEAAALGIRWCATRLRETITSALTGKGPQGD